MAQIHWASAKSGLFNTAADWTGGVVPGASDDAILNAAGTINYVVTVTTSGTVSSIQTLATATLEVKVGSAAGGFTATTGSGSGKNGGAILVADGGEFIFDGTIDNTGKIDLNSTGDATELAIGASGGTLTGLGHLTLTDNAGNLVEATAAGATLVNDGNVISGAGTIGGGGLALVNDAHDRIEAEGSAALVIGGSANTVVNLGTLESTTVGGPTLGGLILDDDTINNVGGLIYADGAGTQVGLESTTLDGGILQSAAGGVITTLNSGDTLSAASGDLVLEAAVQVANGDSLTISGGMELVGGDGGALDVDGSSATTELLVAAGGARLVHLGSVVMSDSADNDIAASTAGAKLEVVAATISGSGTIGGGGLDVVLYGNGMIDATGTANALTLNTGAYSIVNSGLIEATGSAGLVIDSNLRNTSTGEVKVLDGSSLTTNNATITGGTLLVGTGSSVDLNAVDVSGVTLTTQGTGTISLGGGTSLTSKDSLAGSFAVTPGTDLYVSGALDVAGTLTMITNFESENGTQIVLRGSTEFEGGGDVYMGGTIWNQNFINGNGNRNVNGTIAGYALINLDDTISGAGHLGIGGLGNGWLNIVNDASGVIDGDAATGYLILSNGNHSTIVNDGTLEGASAGGIQITGVVANAGTLLAVNGGVVSLNGVDILGGDVVTTGSGVVDINGVNAFNTVDNSGHVAINDGDQLQITGSLINSGSIAITGYGHGASLELFGAVTLSGGGKVVMGGTAPWNDAIFGRNAISMLTIAGQTVSGGGTISVTTVNDAGSVIDGSSTFDALAIDVSGADGLTNKGLIEAMGGGGILIVGTSVQNTGGTLLAAAGSTVSIDSSSIVGGSIKSAGSGVVDIVGYASTWTGVTASASVYLGDGNALYLSGLIENTGTISLANGGHGGGLRVSSGVTATLAGAGVVSMGGASPGSDSIGGAGDLVNDQTIRGGGSIELTTVNSGVIDGSSTAAAIEILVTGTYGITNKDLIEATGGGGINIVQTAINNAGGTILAATGSTVTLNNSTLVGGYLESTGTGTVDVVGYPNTWVGVTTSAHVYIGDGPQLYLSGIIDNTGTITLANGGHGGGLRVSNGGSATLSGAGVIDMAGSSPWDNALAGAGSLTNDQTIEGGGVIELDFTNAGVVDATSTAANMTFHVTGTYGVVNTGLIEATSGGINIAQTQVNNTGGTIKAATGSTVTINNSLIKGGELESSGTGVIDVIGYPSTWSGLTNAANVYMGDGPNLYLGGIIDNTGTITMAEGGHGGGLHVSGGSATLTGTGVVIMGGTGPWNDRIGGSGTLTNAQTIMGGGFVGNGLTIVNAVGGVIEASSSLYGLVLNAATLTNAGTLTSISGDTLLINDAVVNTGVIETAGGVTSINSGLSGAGKLIVNGGGTLVVNTGGAVSEATSFGTGGGTLQLDQSQSFTGRIADFTTTGSTVLDLRDIGFVSASEATFVENAGDTTGTLTVKANGATATLTLVGDYAGDTFTASSDGSGGVDIVASPAPAVAPVRLVAAMAAMTSGSSATTSHAFSVHPQAVTTLLAHTGGG